MRSSLNSFTVMLISQVSANKSAYRPAALSPFIYESVIRIVCRALGMLSKPIRYHCTPWYQFLNLALSPSNVSGLLAIDLPSHDPSKSPWFGRMGSRGSHTIGDGGVAGNGWLRGEVYCIAAGGCGGGPAVIGLDAYIMFHVAYCHRNSSCVCAAGAVLMYDGPATGVGDMGVWVLILAKSSDRSDIFTPDSALSLQTFAISSDIVTPFSTCCRCGVSGGTEGDGADGRD